MTLVWEGAKDGALIGAEVGTVEPGAGNVIGAIAGGIIGAGLGIAGISLINHLSKANSDSKSKLKEGAKDETCPTCAKKIKCFKTPKKGTDAEMDRQLKEQEDKINSMKPEDLIKNIDKYSSEGRGAGDAAARQEARDTAEALKTQQLQKKYLADGMSEGDAATKAAADAEDYMNGVDATHTLDMIAGGDGSLSGVGGSSENRSIGSQWGKGGRAEELRDAAEKQKGQDKMNVKLERCK